MVITSYRVSARVLVIIESPKWDAMPELIEIEVTIKVKLAVPAEWPKPKQVYGGPLADFWRSVVCSIADKWRPQVGVWDGDWKHYLVGEVTDVELDAGDWGYDTWTPESDTRLRIEMVMVDRNA